MQANYDVVIVGGGPAGLRAAETLHKSNKFESIAILEAQDRFGGRTCTVSNGDNTDTIDIGGQWVGPTQHKVLQLLDHYNIEKIEQTFSPPFVLPTGEVRSRFVEMININLVPLSDEEKLEVLAFENYVIELCNKMDVNKPWEIENAIELDSMSTSDYIEKNIKLQGSKIELLLFVQGMVSSDPKDCSFLFFVYFVKSSGGFESLGDGPNGMQKWKLRGGAQQISELYANDIQKLGVVAHKSCVVTSIHKDGDIFVIDCNHNNNTRAIHCKRVIIAMSPALAIRKIKFGEGIINEKKQKLYESIHPGRAVKIILSYETEFWHLDNNHRFPAMSIDDLQSFVAHNIFPSTVGKNPALVLLITGSSVDRYTKISQEQGIEVARSDVFKQLAHIYDFPYDVVSKPVEIFEKNWSLEPFAYGCFAGFLPPNSLAVYGSEMRTSCNGVHWAATETAAEFYAYIEGALRAGEYAANQLLGEL